MRGNLASDGTLDLDYLTELGGAAAVGMRQIFPVPMDTAKRGQFTRALAGTLYNGATGDSLVTFAGKDLGAMPPRQFPIDAAAVVGPVVNSADVRITLPAGWNARLPRSVHADGPFGSYTSEYEQVGRELHLTRRLAGKRGTLPPDQMKALVTWLRSVGADDAEFVVLDHPAAPQ